MSGFTLEQRTDDGEGTTRLIPVEDGKWIVPHVGTGASNEEEWEDDGGDDGGYGYVMLQQINETSTYKVVGPEPIRHVLSRFRTSNNWHGGRCSHTSSSSALVGDRPFGVILETSENGRPGIGSVFVCSRQVHKGELGHRPEIVRPRFAREAPETDAVVSHVTGRPIKSRDRRRGHVGWARLTDVAELVGLGVDELVRRYARFAHAVGHALDVRFAERREEIHLQPPRMPMRFAAYRIEELFMHDLRTAWVRKGFACTVLYLHHFGYVPVPASESACRSDLAASLSVSP